MRVRGDPKGAFEAFPVGNGKGKDGGGGSGGAGSNVELEGKQFVMSSGDLQRMMKAWIEEAVEEG